MIEILEVCDPSSSQGMDSDPFFDAALEKSISVRSEFQTSMEKGLQAWRNSGRTPDKLSRLVPP